MASSGTGCDPVVIESDENNSSQNELDSENNFKCCQGKKTYKAEDVLRLKKEKKCLLVIFSHWRKCCRKWKINWTNRFKYNLLMLKINVWQFIFIKVWSENNVLLYYSGSYSKSIHYFLIKLNLTLELTLPLFIVNRR